MIKCNGILRQSAEIETFDKSTNGLLNILHLLLAEKANSTRFTHSQQIVHQIQIQIRRQIPAQHFQYKNITVVGLIGDSAHLIAAKRKKGNRTQATNAIAFAGHCKNAAH